MRRGPSGFALVMVLSCGMPAQAQSAAPSTAAPEGLRTHLRSERFTPVTKVAALPAKLRDELRDLFGDRTLELADPGMPFQATDSVQLPRLPWRRLVAAGCSPDHCLVYYERGGFVHVHYAVVFKVSADGTRFEFGGGAPRGLADLDAVKNAIATGNVLGQKQTGNW